MVSAALRANSKPRQALKTALESFELCVSEGTLSELGTVLARPKFARYAPAEAPRAFIESIRADGRMFSVSAEDLEKVEPRCRDVEDHHILALAAVAKVDVIVSSDHDLLVLHPWREIPIVTPAQFLAQFVP
ncbi:MAG: putative toxin-antitoxin system toxin component, PIN family [Terracidiphilus sp.]